MWYLPIFAQGLGAHESQTPRWPGGEHQTLNLRSHAVQGSLVWQLSVGEDGLRSKRGILVFLGDACWPPHGFVHFEG